MRAIFALLGLCIPENQMLETAAGIHGPQVRCDKNATAPPPPAPPHVPPPPPGEHQERKDTWVLIHYATNETYGDHTAWKVHNATILDLPTDFQMRGGAGVGLGTYTEGNWNPAPVALPDGRVRIMVHTGWSGLPNFKVSTQATSLAVACD